MDLRLEPDEAAYLKQLLTSYLPDLKMEISNTEDYDLREALKRNESMLRSLIERLEAAGAR